MAYSPSPYRDKNALADSDTDVIDPSDLDLCSSHLQTNFGRLIAKFSIILNY